VQPDEDQRFKAIVEAASDAILSSSLDGVIESWNPGAERLFGYSSAEAIGMHLLRLVPREDREQILTLLRRVAAGESLDGIESKRLLRDGSELEVSLSLSPIRDRGEKVVGVAAVARDISSRKRFEEQLRELALRDPLTGLYNRRQFEAELERELALARRTGRRGVVLMIDLDRFKDVNDAFGHAAGDEMLCAVAGVLARRLRSSDLIARIGGDEFAAILLDSDAEMGDAIARSLEERINALRGGTEGAITTSASIGSAPFGAEDDGRGEVLQRADEAMYARKREKV
jgi:diguanylate cyclase (GGDEF)-like protein/PAS domain S-box-containing protein